MEITKIINTSSEHLSKEIVEKLSMRAVESNNLYSTYEIVRVSEDGENEKLVLCLHQEDSQSISESSMHIFETYQVYKLIHVGIVWVSGNLDIHPWDVMLPNTFITADSPTPIFLDFAVGENYDFKNFGLILSGICMTWEPSDDMDEEDYGADIYDKESFYILESMQKNEALDKTVVIKAIFNPDDDKVLLDTVSNNAFAILDFIL